MLLRFRAGIFALCSIAGLGCSSSKDPLTPTVMEQNALNKQVELVFAGVMPHDGDSFGTDVAAVRALHQFCYAVNAYHELTQRYPLSDRLADGSWVQCVVYGNVSQIDYENPVNVRGEELLADMQAVLGSGLALPNDPNVADWLGLYYTTSGPGFLAVVDLSHPVNGGEMVTADQGQYRIASYRSDAIPQFEFGAILKGELTALPGPVWRDPSLRPTR